MSSKTKVILVLLVVILLALGTVVAAYLISKKSVTVQTNGGTPPPMQSEIDSAPKMGRFDLGEFIATSRDEELHYIKIQVEVGFLGSLEKELAERKSELRDAIVNHLMKLTVQRAKEDNIDRFLHKDIERELNRVLGKSTSESRIVSVFIPSFLVN